MEIGPTITFLFKYPFILAIHHSLCVVYTLHGSMVRECVSNSYKCSSLNVQSTCFWINMTFGRKLKYTNSVAFLFNARFNGNKTYIIVISSSTVVIGIIVSKLNYIYIFSVGNFYADILSSKRIVTHLQVNFGHIAEDAGFQIR